MMDPRIKSALDKREPGGHTLTVAGFARHALKLKLPLTGADRKRARDLMIEAFGEPRRVPHDGVMVDCWDYQK